MSVICDKRHKKLQHSFRKVRSTATSYKCVNHEWSPKTSWNAPVPKLSASGSGFYVHQAMEHSSPLNKTTFDISTNPEDRCSTKRRTVKRTLRRFRSDQPPETSRRNLPRGPGDRCAPQMTNGSTINWKPRPSRPSFNT
jgi:hypothetical protein